MTKKFKKINSIFRMYESSPIDWDLRKLGDFATIVKVKHSNEINAPVLSMTKHQGFVKSLEYHNKQIFSKDISKYKLVKKDQFAYATIHLDEGSIGLLEKFENGYISPMYTVFQVDSTINKKYLIRLMKTKSYLFKYSAIGEGTVNRRKSVKFSDLSKLKMPLPSLPEQEKIEGIISNMDSLIESTSKIIENSKKVKNGLTQKLLTRGLGHTKFKKISWYYNKEIEIPEEWEVKRIADTGEFINGLNKNKEDYGHGCLHVNIDNIFQSFVIDPTKVGRVNATNNEIITYGLQDGDICLLRSSVKRDGIGYPALFLKNNEPVVFSGFIMRFRPNQQIWNSFFLTFLLRAEIMRKIVISRSTSSANTNINQPSYGSIQIYVPPLQEQQKITSILSNIDSMITLQEQYKEKLEKLKKSLMQKLLTGEVRV
jgi:type I restriction enzyme, S subunit